MVHSLWVDKWSFRWGKPKPEIPRCLSVRITRNRSNPIGCNRNCHCPLHRFARRHTIKSTGNKLFVNHKPVAQPPLILEAYLSPDSLEHRVNRMMRQNNSFFVEQGKLKDSRLLFLSRYDYEKVKETTIGRLPTLPGISEKRFL